MKRSILTAVVALLAGAFVSTKVTAQAPPATDVNVALIRELHDLRIAIEKLASASSRVQVLSTRVSQQEQRISSLTTQLIPLTSKLAEASAETVSTNSSLERSKESLRLASDPQQRGLIEGMQKELTMQLDRDRFMQASVQAQVDAVRQQIGTEQSTLSDLQRKLDDLDHSMADPHE